MNKQEVKAIIDALDYKLMVSPWGDDDYPLPGEYVLTGIQAGNLHGEKGLHFRIGYVVQIRKKAGAFGSHIVLLRHPDGTLMSHMNQTFVRVSEEWQERVKAVFAKGITPSEMEDYSQPYTLGGEFPEIGGIIELKEDQVPAGESESPMVAITITHADGSKSITVC